MPVDIECVGGPMDGRRVTLPCTPEDLPAALKATDHLERLDLEAQARSVRYEARFSYSYGRRTCSRE